MTKAAKFMKIKLNIILLWWADMDRMDNIMPPMEIIGIEKNSLSHVRIIIWYSLVLLRWIEVWLECFIGRVRE